MPNSKQKGKRGERELSKVLNGMGFTTRRGQQFKGTPDSPDVVGIDGIHIECKRTEKLSVYRAMEQAEQDAGDNVPVVMHRVSRKPWLVILKLDDLFKFIDAVNKEV